MKKRAVIKENIPLLIFISLIFIILITTSASAGWFDWLKKTITGEITQVKLNITIGVGTAPTIPKVFNNTILAVTLNGGPSVTKISVNFTACDVEGAVNLNDATAKVNLTKVGETTRYNSTCKKKATAGICVNYSCMVQIWWFDGAGTWKINASINDLNYNNGTNKSVTFTVNPLTQFELGPATLPWGAVSPGSTNQTPTSQAPIALNNTGNVDIAARGIKVNATSLMGETTTTQGLYSGNFTVSNTTSAGAPNLECNTKNVTAVRMSQVSGANFMPINASKVRATLASGNYTLDDGTAQEKLYVCLIKVGSEISSQSYSTSLKGSWTISIT